MRSTPFNFFIQNKNPKPRSSSSSRTSTHDLDIIKAAAWAWYQHGSGSEGKITRESDVFRPHRPPRPSRYQLEAMRISHTLSQSPTPSPIHTPNNSLLDNFEIESISKELDFLMESRKFDDGGSYEKKKKNKNQKPKFKGFWPRHVVTCGAKEDMVDTTAYRSSRQPARLVPVMRLVTSKPRTNHDLKT
ncbi:hypothetical protein HS088_TW03G00341 [Tripterygium wilfordii]|uniref:Uncharacterized protein n=1 Tax=Tripterygium wilfordii TaxID=458696 RepID=A0A7J7DUG5_TRIWF|nr:uncharacterized protein LOC119995447 [Tripterygium wilfordii]KAF5750012.1 hypothetical protein HS088_TW03G00341 [Tripterygium wilfordii]